MPPGPFALDRCREAAARRVGVEAVYEADGRRIDLIIKGAGGARFDAGLPPGVDSAVTALLAGRADRALKQLGGDPGRSALVLWLGAPALAVGVGAPREPGPRVLLHPERFTPLGLVAPGFVVRLRDVRGLLTAYDLPTVLEVEVEGLGVWTARLAGPPVRRK